VSNHNLIAVNRSTGSVAWNYFADAQIRNSAVITSDRKLVFATQKGTLYGFDLNNLSLPAAPTWQMSLPDSAPGSIALDNEGCIYVGTGAGRLLKISMPANHQASVVWQVLIGQAITGSPVIGANGILYVGSLNTTLYAVDIQSGNVKWMFSTKGAIRSTPTISDAGTIYVANDSGEIISLDSTKNVLWYYRTNSAVVAPLLYYNSTLYVGTLGYQVIALYDGSDSSRTGSLTGATSPTQTAETPVWGTFQGNNQRTGLFSASGTTGIKNPSGPIPTAYVLMQNYPNPFNPSTTLQYGLPTRSRVRLQVYNILGQVVAELVNAEQSAGWNRVVWNAIVPSGFYFYRLEAVSVDDPGKRLVDVKKMLLLK
jgi:outer membrane protein assembly factor BamB